MDDQREATLDDLLNEPIILKVMASDGVRGSDIRQLLQQVRHRQEQNFLALASQASHQHARTARGGCHIF